ALGIAALALHFRDRALADAERELGNTALILAEQSDRAFQALDLVQKSLIERMQALGIASPQDYARQMSGLDVHLMLKDKINGLPHVASLGVFSADGTLINPSRAWPTPDLNLAERDHFKALKSDPLRVTGISGPIRSSISGTWTLYFARKFNGPDG